MPNRNYIAGRSFEYKRRDHYKGLGYHVIRAAGSHGDYDLVALRPNRQVLAIQCKRVETVAEGNRLVQQFRLTKHSDTYVQVIEVLVTSTKEILTEFV